MAVIGELPTYAVGVDLGQVHDHSAVAILESVELVHDVRDPVTYERRREQRTRLRHLHRIRLGTSYPDVVSVVKEIAAAPVLDGRCTVVVDATGGGIPVVDLFKRAGMRARVVPVSITPGDRENSDGSKFRVPRRELISGLQVLFEDKKFEIPSGLANTKSLIDELALMRGNLRSTGHDDLVFALSLAWWWTRKKTPGIWGTKPLI